MITTAPTRLIYAALPLLSSLTNKPPPTPPPTIGYGGYCIKAECDKHDKDGKVGTYVGLSNDYSVVDDTQAFCEARRGRKGERCDKDVRVSFLPNYPQHKCIGLFFVFDEKKGGGIARLR